MHKEFHINVSSHLRTAVIIVALMLAIGGDAQAKKIYKWVDENGKTHYGDNAPRDIGAAQEVHVPNTPAVDAGVNTRQQRTERLLDSYKQDRYEKRELRQAAAEAKKKRKANCAIAKESQYEYAHAQTLYRRDADGNRINLTDEEYAAAIAELQAEVDEWCD